MDNEMSEYRYERKFFISSLSTNEIISLVKLNSFQFSKIFEKRYVNNIYFDSFNLENYFDNVDGIMHRKKYRIRWYGNLFGLVKNPTFEIKVKKGLVGLKHLYPINPFELSENYKHEIIVNSFIMSSIPVKIKEWIKNLYPTLLNRYSREYYLSKNKNFRITVDTNQVFININRHSNTFSNRQNDNVNTILELKYEDQHSDEASAVTNEFNFRMTKSSKYVHGIKKVYF